MPCRSDYMEPNERERESKIVAGHLQYLIEGLQLSFPSSFLDGIGQAAKEEYGNSSMLDKYTAELCDICNKLTEKQKTKYIYDGRNPKARKLADWWDHHQAADKKRVEKEKLRDENDKIIKQAMAKLSIREMKALGLLK